MPSTKSRIFRNVSNRLQANDPEKHLTVLIDIRIKEEKMKRTFTRMGICVVLAQ